MKKKLFTLLIISAAICALGWGAVSAYAAEGDESGTALFMPSSYEQYLSLENPSDFAVNEQYIAVADGGIIYVYDKNESVFATYTHTTSTSTLSSLNFYESGGSCYLLFVDSNTNIYYIDCGSRADDDTFSSTPLSFTCASFIIQGETLYYSRTTSGAVVYRTAMSLSSLAEGETIEQDATTSITPYFSMSGSELYFSLNSRVYLVTESGAPQEYRSVSSSITAFSVTDDKIFYSTTGSDRDFLVYQNQTSETVQYNGNPITGVPSVKLVGNELWFIENQNIRLLDPFTSEGYSFLDYTIGKYADIANRIGQNASDLSVCGSRIAVADTGNERVLLAEKSANGSYTYKEIKTEDFSPSLICAQENTFAVASNRSLRIYPYDGDSYTEVKTNFGAAIGGIAYSYGKYFVAVSGMSILYEIDETSGQATEHDLDTAISSVTADIHGNLYILSGTSVQKYDSDFTALATYTAPSGTKKILCDYEGNLYALDQSGSIFSLREDGSQQRVFTPLEDLNGLVYYGSDTPSAVSFAFGFESKDVYVLSDGFIAVTQKLGVKSLNDLDADGVYAALFDTPLSSDDYNGLLVNVAPSSAVIALDVTELSQNSAVLPYHGYQKTAEAMTGVVLAETGDGTLVGVFTKTPSGEVDVLYSYNVWLVLKDGGEDSVTAVDGARYLSSPDYSDGYVVEAVGLYRFPQMRLGENGSFTDFARMQELPKNTAVTVLQKIGNGALDAVYCFVSAELDGQTVYGYVPAGFILKSGNAGVASGTQFRYARLDRGESATLLHKNTGEGITLSDREQLKVYDSLTDENGNVYAEYTNENGTYAGYIDPAILYNATPVVMVTLVIVMVAAAAVILSVCYLLLRKQPTLQ